MEMEGVVSVWIGVGIGNESFSRLLEYQITDDGNFKACDFCQAIGVDSYDPDDFGGRYFPKVITRPKILFHGTELSSKVSERIPELPPSS